MSLEHKFEDGLDDGLWVGGHPIIINGYGVFDKDAKDLQAIVTAEIIAELERLRDLTRKHTYNKANLSHITVGQDITVHTNSLIEHRLAELKAKETQL